MRFKILILVLSLLFISAKTYSQGSWERIDSPTDKFLKSVYFVDSLYGWAVGDSGTIIYTSDGGDNWIVQGSKTENEIVDVFFLNRNLGWASAWNYNSYPFGTILLKTTNGGQDWSSEQYRDDNIFITCILYLDSLNGWMVGDPHAIVRTNDGGITWEHVEIDTVALSLYPVYSIKFFNERYGYACGGALDIAGVTWRTSNGGDKWYPIGDAYAPPEPIRELHLVDSINVIGVGGDWEHFFGLGIIRTSDGGGIWQYEELEFAGVGYDLEFRNNNEAWSPLGPDQMFMFSIDGGSTWTQLPTPESTVIYDIIFPDSLHGFAVGVEGAILKYNPPIVDEVKDIVRTIPDGYQLYQNYPNPFNPITKIKFSIPSNQFGETSNVKMVVYDILGNEVATILDKELLPGGYEIDFRAKIDNRQLVSGIYFYQLRVNGFVHTKKMLLIR